MFEKLRAVGVLTCVASSILFFAGGLTDYWVQSDNGHYGLWEYCDSTTVSNTTFNMTTTAMPDFTSRHYDKDDNSDEDDDDDNSDESDDDDDNSDESDEEEDDDDDDDDCSSFNLGSVPAFLHLVRLMMILASVVLAWGLLSGRTIRWKIDRRPSFIQTHLAELLGIIACVMVYLGLLYFAGNYKTFRSEKYPNRKLGWSYQMVKIASFWYLPTAVFLMSPSLHAKYKEGCHGIFPTWNDCYTLKMLCIRIGLKKPPSLEVTVDESGSVRNSAGDRPAHSVVSLDSDVDTDIALGIHDISLQMSETGSDIFTLTNNNGGISNGIPHSTSDPPAYEDVAESNAEPAPPTYDEFMTGQYLTFAPSSYPTEPSAPLPPPYSSSVV